VCACGVRVDFKYLGITVPIKIEFMLATIPFINICPLGPHLET
jgi:hypothetical protein